MDTAVGLVQAYLRVNGYFTVAEYPVLDAAGADRPRTVTDLDILAIRLSRDSSSRSTLVGVDLIAMMASFRLMWCREPPGAVI